MNCFINTTDLISLSLNFPFKLLFNSQYTVFLYQDNPQQITPYEVNQLEEIIIGQTNLIESFNTLSHFKSINLPYKQIKFSKSCLQIDYKEILAIIDISNNLNPSLIPPLHQPQINLSSREI